MDAHIIIAGDSNALGFLNLGPAPYTPNARIQIWTGTAWNYMNPGANTGTPENPNVWAREVQIANRWLADNPTGYLWIVKNADTVKGGTTLAVDWNPWTGAYFASTTQTASAAMHNLDGGQFAFTRYEAAFVGLGENDATHHDMASAYLVNLTAFDFAARSAWHVDKLVEYRITEGAGSPEDNLAVRQAQWQADQADPALETFKTIGLAMRPDGIHYADHVALGDLSYDGVDDLSDRILIAAGRRNGRSFDNEREFVNALDAGKQVFTKRNDVYFEVTADGEGVRYAALIAKPEGI